MTSSKFRPVHLAVEGKAGRQGLSSGCPLLHFVLLAAPPQGVDCSVLNTAVDALFHAFPRSDEVTVAFTAR
jgi:hypothetical protein